MSIFSASRRPAFLATRTLLSSLDAVDMWFKKIDGQPDDAVDDLARQTVDLLIGGIAAPPSAGVEQSGGRG